MTQERPLSHGLGLYAEKKFFLFVPEELFFFVYAHFWANKDGWKLQKYLLLFAEISTSGFVV